jgi:peroxiredoxin
MTCPRRVPRCRSMSLKALLETCRREYEGNADPQGVDAERRSIRELAQTGLVAKAIKAGEMAPRFRLRCGRGDVVELSGLLNRGPVVISFFRGDWCPFCVIELKALAAAHPEIEQLGATLISLSPQARGKSSSAGNGGKPPLLVLQDRGCEIAARYRIAFTVPQQLRAAYLTLGYPNPAKTGSKGWVLPIPATDVIDRDGLVVLAYLDADYTTRLEPSYIFVALTHLRDRGHSRQE